ncbi:hypothetical protein [Lacrimispora amygdalina]|nr:hypothetical protein [Lacrimispora amygdalina]
MMQVKGRCTLRRSCRFAAAGNADCIRVSIKAFLFYQVAVNIDQGTF